MRTLAHVHVHHTAPRAQRLACQIVLGTFAVPFVWQLLPVVLGQDSLAGSVPCVLRIQSACRAELAVVSGEVFAALGLVQVDISQNPPAWSRDRPLKGRKLALA